MKKGRGRDRQTDRQTDRQIEAETERGTHTRKRGGEERDRDQTVTKAHRNLKMTRTHREHASNSETQDTYTDPSTEHDMYTRPSTDHDMYTQSPIANTDEQWR